MLRTPIPVSVDDDETEEDVDLPTTDPVRFGAVRFGADCLLTGVGLYAVAGLLIVLKPVFKYAIFSLKNSKQKKYGAVAVEIKLN